MKSKKQKYMLIILSILFFLQKILGAKYPNRVQNPFEIKENNIPRKLQTDNYVILNFGDSFVSDTCWFNNFDDKISSVEINDVQRTDYISGLSLSVENTMKIHFNSNLDELKYFLGYNEEKSSSYNSNCQNSAAFTLRSHITSIDFSHLITSEVTSTSNMFNGYTSLKVVNLEEFDASALVSMDYMFNGCSSLHTIYLSELSATEVTTMERMFNGCSSLTSVDLSKISTSQVQNMKYMFNGCRALKKIDLTNVRTSNADSSQFEFIFNDCSSLIALYIPYFYMSQISTETHMFDNVNKLKYIDIEYMSISHTSPSDQSACNNKADCLWPLNFGNHLVVCQSETKKFILEENIIELCCSFDAEVGACQLSNYITVYYKEECTYPNGFNNYIYTIRNSRIKFINYNNSTFLDNRELNILGNSKIDIEINTGLDELNNFFYRLDDDETTDQNLLKVVSIDLSHFDCSSITSLYNFFRGCKLTAIARMFMDCSSLKSLDLSGFNTDNIGDMQNLINGCESLKLLDISNFHLTSMGDNTIFKGAVNLKYINAKNLEVDDNTVFITDSNNALIICQRYGNNFDSSGTNSIYGLCCSFNIETEMCESNNYIEVYYNNACNYNNFNREYLSFINYNYMTVPSGAQLNIVAGTKLQLNFDIPLTSIEKFFSQSEDEHMNKVISIDFSHFDTSALVNMDSVFYGCSSLKSLDLSTFQTTSVTSMSNLFYNCVSLEVLDISNFNMAQTTNAENMFFGLNSLIFINLYNTQDDDKITASSLNRDTERIFYICQENDIITNPNSINCCSYPNLEACNAESKEIEINYNKIISDMGSQDFKVVKTLNSIIQYSTVKDQMTNADNSFSSIDLGDCENKLRQQEGLSESEEFLMVKLDIKNSTTNAVFVQYEIFNPRDNSKVTLDICNNDKIKIQVPVSLTNEEFSLIESFDDYDYNIFDLKDDFYNDICTPYTAQNGADMVLSSRKDLVYDQLKDNYYCQEGCDLESFDTKTSKAECLCQVQKAATIIDLLEISFDKKEFFDGFYNTLFNSNFRVLKCIKLLFSIDGIKTNYGFYFMTFLLASFIAFVVIHFHTGFKKITNIVNLILEKKVIDEKQDINNIEEKKQKNEEKKKKSMKKWK